jgi:hypothetical protein
VRRLSIAVRYALLLVVSTAGAMTLAVGLIIVCAFVAGLLRVQVSALAYQRLASTPPYTVQMFSAFLLAIALSGNRSNRNCGVWVWVAPAMWMLMALMIWQPVKGAGSSVWQYFFTGSWWQLRPSPFRSQWVAAQFTYTVPLFTSVAYALGALLRRLGTARRVFEEPSASSA